MLVNTTVSDIENEIKGVDDARNVRHDKKDYIRKLEVFDVNVTSVQLSKEKTYDKFIDSVIVIYVNETETNDTSSDDDDNEWQHGVMRYWQDPTTFWIDSEYLFDTQKEKRVFYEGLDIFDEWAIAYKDNVFEVIFYKIAKGNLVPENYHVKAYEQENAYIAGYTFFDQSGKGSWDLIILQKYTGSIIVTPVQMVISPSNYNVRFSAATNSNTFMKASTEPTKMFAPNQLLAIGCKTCNNDDGLIY